MERTLALRSSTIYFPHLESPRRTHFHRTWLQITPSTSKSQSFFLKISSTLGPPNDYPHKTEAEAAIPTMSDIIEASRRQKLDLQLQNLGPFFRITAKSLETQKELGRAEGLIRFWLGGKILHLDSIRLRRDTLGMEKSIFGIGLFIGAVAIRYGYDCGCKRVELLAINDTDLYHSKVSPFFLLKPSFFFKSLYILRFGYHWRIKKKVNF